MDRVKAENFLAKWHWWIIWLDLIKSKAKRAVKDAAS